MIYKYLLFSALMGFLTQKLWNYWLQVHLAEPPTKGSWPAMLFLLAWPVFLVLILTIYSVSFFSPQYYTFFIHQVKLLQDQDREDSL